MAHHRLGHPDRARDAFDRTDQWMQTVPWNEVARRIRAEAADLLGQTRRDPPHPEHLEKTTARTEKPGSQPDVVRRSGRNA